MQALIIYPHTKDQLRALKAIAKAWKLKVETSPYDPDFVTMVKEAENRGNYRDIDPADIQGNFKLK